MMTLSDQFTTPLQGTPYYSSSGLIKAVDRENRQYPVAEISFQRFDDQNFQYIFTPFREIISYLPPTLFQGIPGIDLDLQRDCYYRVNLTPTFIEMRTPGPSREDLWELLEKAGLDYYDRFEWLLRTQTRCGNDNLIVVRRRPGEAFHYPSKDVSLHDLQPGDRIFLQNLSDIADPGSDFEEDLFCLLASGAEIIIETEERKIDEEQRRSMLYTLSILKQYSENKGTTNRKAGILRARADGKYRGRKKHPVDPLLLQETAQRFHRGELTETEAMQLVGIRSRSTFYRRLRECK